MHNTAALQHEGVLRQPQGDVGVLLHQDEGVCAFAGHPPDRCGELFDHDRRQTFEWLIEQQQRRISHKRAGDRQHLLLAAGELIAEIAPAFGEPREQVVHIAELPAPIARGHGEIFLDAERREDFAFLRDPTNAAKRAAMGWISGDVAAAPENAAATDVRIAHDGQEQRRLADTVSSEYGKTAVLRQLKRYVVEHDGGAITCAHTVKCKQRLGHDASPAVLAGILLSALPR